MSRFYRQYNLILADFTTIKEVLKKIKWPTENDFKGAIHGLLRVQYTYQLDIVLLAKGSNP